MPIKDGIDEALNLKRKAEERIIAQGALATAFNLALRAVQSAHCQECAVKELGRMYQMVLNGAFVFEQTILNDEDEDLRKED